MSLKVINILSIDEFLTVDNTIVSVDQTNISADQLEMTPVDSILKVPYRFFNSEVKLVLWNEIKETKSTLLLNSLPWNFLNSSSLDKGLDSSLLF